MHLLVFSPYAINTPHYETQLEIIEDHLQRGDAVTFLGCNMELASCDVNYGKYEPFCMKCMSKRNAGLKLLSKHISFKTFCLLNEANKEELRSVKTEFKNFPELKEYRIENFDIGFGVASSLISISKEANPDIDVYKELIAKLLVSSLTVYRSIQNHLEEIRPDLLCAYNGRYAPLRAAIRAAQSRNVPFKVHEIGHTLQHYGVWENTIPHDLVYTERRIRDQWSEAAGDPWREEIASKFYEDRARGIEYVYLSFTKEQHQDLLPANWSPDRKNIVLFNSSEYEFAAIGDEWRNKIYKSQQEGIAEILKSLNDSRRQDIHMYLRMHPNLKEVSDPAVQALLQMSDPHLTVIPPESPISTYALLRNANKAVTFSSTVGIEAVYWGIPSILLGMSHYHNLGGTYNPQSHEEAMSLILSDLVPREKEAALMFGYYMNTFGIPFKYYQATEIFEGKFKGVKVEPARWLNEAFAEEDRRPRLKRPIRAISLYLLRKGV